MPAAPVGGALGYGGRMSDLVAGLKALAAARPAVEEAEQFYEGTADEIIASKKLARALGESGDKFRMNYARIVVSSRLDKLELSAVTASTPEAAKLLDELWTDKELADETQDTHEGACEYGDGYVIVWPSEVDDADNVLDVDIYYNSPQNVRMFYSTENTREPEYAIKTWAIARGNEKLLRVNLYYADRIERYISITEVKDTPTDQQFVPFVDDAYDATDEEDGYEGTWPIPNPWNRLPVFHFRTARPYGRPIHRDAFGPQNAINKLIATQMGNVDFTGMPQRYAIQDEAANGGVSEVDNDFADDEIRVGGDDVNKSDDPKLRSEPGSVWWLKNVKAVGQFQTADQAAFLEPMREYVSGMSVTTKTPLSAFRIGGQLPSGESRRADDAPLNGHVSELKRRFGTTWKALYGFVLELYGLEADVDVTWAPLETFDDKDTWEVAALQIESGVPLRRVLVERGYTEEQCNDWGVPDYGAVSAADQSTNLAATAAAVRDLGTASTLGVVSEAQVQQIVQKITAA